MWQLLRTTLIETAIVAVFGVCLIQVGEAEVMSSGNFQIQSDSLNAGGGFSTSTNYELESTVGEVGTGNSTSTSYALRAGYQQMQEVYVAMTPISDAVLSPAIPGLAGGTSNASTSFNLTTDSPSGYSITIRASTSPALRSDTVGDSIPNYVPGGATPDYSFTFGAGDALFGFTPEGAAIVERYQDSGGLCGVAGSDTASACWDGLATTTREIVRAAVGNHPNGATTTLRFRVGVGSSAGVTAGTYIAPLVVTAVPL